MKSLFNAEEIAAAVNNLVEFSKEYDEADEAGTLTDSMEKGVEDAWTNFCAMVGAQIGRAPSGSTAQRK